MIDLCVDIPHLVFGHDLQFMFAGAAAFVEFIYKPPALIVAEAKPVSIEGGGKLFDVFGVVCYNKYQLL